MHTPRLIDNELAIAFAKNTGRATRDQRRDFVFRIIAPDWQPRRGARGCFPFRRITCAFDSGAKTANNPLAHIRYIRLSPFSAVVFGHRQIEGREHDWEVLERELLDREMEAVPVGKRRRHNPVPRDPTSFV